MQHSRIRNPRTAVAVDNNRLEGGFCELSEPIFAHVLIPERLNQGN
jgi:hypothetical protein